MCMCIMNNSKSVLLYISLYYLINYLFISPMPPLQNHFIFHYRMKVVTHRISLIFSSNDFRVVCRVGAGDGYSVFVSDSGMMMSCGDGTFGCLGHCDWNNSIRPRLIGECTHLECGVYLTDNDAVQGRVGRFSNSLLHTVFVI